jgi:hypothetical protein
MTGLKKLHLEEQAEAAKSQHDVIVSSILASMELCRKEERKMVIKHRAQTSLRYFGGDTLFASCAGRY